MKTFKKALAVVLCVVMTLTVAPLSGFYGMELPSLFNFKAEAASYSGTCGAEGDNLTWLLDTSKGVLTITGTGAMKDYTLFSRASWHNYVSSISKIVIGSDITSIGNWAFSDCTKLMSVTIPANVTNIGEHTFDNCTSITSITVDKDNKFYSSDNYGVLFDKDKTTLIQYPVGNTRTNYVIPDSVITIGNSSFEGCTSLKSVTIGNSVTSIGNYAFSGSYLNNITLGDSVIIIGEYAFSYCSSLSSATIGNSVTTIGKHAFDGCINLSNIIIGNSVTNIDDYAFTKCYRLKSVTIPDSVTTIGERAFYRCDDLYSVTIGSGILYIGEYAFSTCKWLTDLTISGSVESIGNFAFGDSDNLENVYFNGSVSDWCSIKYGNKDASLTYCAEKVYINGEILSGTVELEPGISSVENYAFYGFDQIRKVVIPDGVTKIGDYAFYDCTVLSNVVLPSKLESVGAYAFYNCDNLPSVVFPNKVKEIGTYAFFDCDGLTSTTFPSSIKLIDNDSFGSCDSLENVNFPNSAMDLSIGTRAFGATKINNIIIPYGTTSMGSHVFSTKHSNIFIKIELPNTIKSIGEFIIDHGYIYYEGTLGEWCAVESGMRDNPDYVYSVTTYVDGKHLTEEIIIPNGVKRIGSHSFSEKYILNVQIPDSVTSIGIGAFKNSSINNINIADNITSVEKEAFYNCTALTGATLGKGITTIEGSTFYNCTSLNKIYLTKNVTSIADYAFYSCTELTDVYFDGTEDEWYNITLGTNNAPLEAATKHFNHVHEYKETVISDSTCTVAGETKYTCECGATYTDTAELKEHTTKDWTVITPATCTTDGKRVKYCSVCKEFVEEEIISSPGHKYESTVTPPTCIADGYTTYTCSVCGDAYTDNTVPSTGHSYKATVVAPTCTKDGYTNNVCSVCGDFYHSDTVEKLGHSKGEWEYIGGKEYAKSCTVCGDKLESKIVTVDMFFDSENVNKKQVLNKSTATVTATVTDNFVNDLVFASSDSSTVSVDANGNVVANNIGKATITVTIKGTAISDSIEVEVLPRDFTITWNVNGKQTKQTVKEEAKFTPNVNTTLKGYRFIGWDKTVPTTMPAESLTFTAQYELIVKQLKIKNPSTSTINYGETLVMHADFGGVELPEGWKIQWTVEGAGFNMAPAADGLTCKMTSVANGNATVKATLVDENGEAVIDADGNEMSDSKQLTSKAGFWQKFVSFFKNLFRISRIILQSI